MRKTTAALFTAALGLTATGQASAAAITKAGSGTDLTAGASWTGSVAPGAGDVATWDTTSLGGTLTYSGNLSWQGIAVTGATAGISINPSSVSGATLTLGSGGISVSGGQNFAITRTGTNGFKSSVELGADQTWSVAAGRTINLNLQYSSSLTDSSSSGAVMDLFGRTLTVLGNGTATAAADIGSFYLQSTGSTGTINVGGTSNNTLVRIASSGSNVNTIVAAGVNLVVANGSILESYASTGTTNKFNGSIQLTGTNSVFRAINTSGTQVNGVISGAGQVSTNGLSGTLTLNAVNTYTGGTSITGGTVVIGSTGSIKVGANGVTLASGTTLTVNGSLALDSTLASITNASGTINFATSGASIIVGNFLDGIGGNTYQLVTNTGTGAINNAGLVGINMTGSAVWASASLSNTGLLTLTAVPEPATYGLIGAGALAAAAFVRRRRATRA